MTKVARKHTGGNPLFAFSVFLDRMMRKVPEGQVLGLFLMQVDQNSRIATSFGRKYTRRFCRMYASRLRKYLPKGAVVIEMPERRFGIALIRSSVPDVVDTGRALMDKVEPRLQIGSEKFSVDVRMGIALYPTHCDDGESLFRRGELALRQAQESQIPMEIYEPDASSFQKALWMFETELKQAINQGILEVYYQPKYEISERRVCGAEALVRWKTQQGRMMPAAEFVPAAERSGAIIPLTWLVFDQVMNSASKFEGLPRPFSISINVPPQALIEPQFFEKLTAVKIELARYDMSLVVELTEDGLMQTDSASIEVLERIRGLGVGLAIDDFGKGYSSLNYLRQIPASELKIDQEFVRSIALDEKDRHIVKTAIELAAAFSMDSVAEGVDNEEALQILEELGCKVIQGYFLARPMSMDALREWILGPAADRFANAFDRAPAKAQQYS